MSDLQARLEAVLAEHDVPGATLGVLDGDDVTVLAAGITNKNTGVEVTDDTLFQIGSITKVWTATLVMMLVDEGVLDLDAPVVTYLPEFKVADADVGARVTLRHLLCHSSGIGGDHILDTGRGDDTLERYLETCAELGQEHELGATMSYCNTGYSVLGRVIEKVTEKSWDAVLRERLIAPLGLTHTNTLPEEAILHRVAVGHVKLPGEDEQQVAPLWVLPRSAGPAGLINATAADLLAFARLHLDEGRAPDGTQLLSVGAVEQMQEPQVEVPDKYTLGDRWGLGWILFDWDGHRAYGHDGTTVGQRAYLRILPEARVAVCLLTNGGNAHSAYRTLLREIAAERAGVTVPSMPTAPDTPTELDLAVYAGHFARLNVDAHLEVDGGRLRGTFKSSGPLAAMLPKDDEGQKIEAVPVDRTLFLASVAEMPDPVPLVFFDFEGEAPRRFHFGARAMTRVDA
jgi:CubicO group peptidase (beta-lactamase class C family)